VEMRKRNKVVIQFELEDTEAEILAADLVYLMDKVKNLPGVVRMQEAMFVTDAQDRLATFINDLREALREKL
jgi:hypothetical protein